MNLADIIQTIAVYALPVLFAITLHEAAHGYVARLCGDMTATMLGRVTLNPVKHIDPIGTVLMPLLLYLGTAGAFVFGYAKPVPVRFDHLRNPKRDMVWVALAGPVSNLAQALLWGVLLTVLLSVGVTEHFFLRMGMAGIMVNLVLFALNLFPLPPLDGGRVLVGLLPRDAAITVSRLEPYGIWIAVALLWSGILTVVWMIPLIRVALAVLTTLLPPLRSLLA